MTAKTLPSAITSYDVLKTFAVIIMIVDHIGAYFFPDALWWRAVGRIGFPVWFFLVGHASGRDLPSKLLIGAGVLTIGNAVSGMPIFPLNALVTIALIRVLIDPVMRIALKSERHLWVVSFLLMILAIPSGILCEYGTMALITAMFGYMVRHREEINNEQLIFKFMIFALALFLILQQIDFGFTPLQFLIMAVGTGLVRLSLYRFESKVYPGVTKRLPLALIFLFQLGGRRTLEIYVLHLLAFKALAVILGGKSFDLFAPELL